MAVEGEELLVRHVLEGLGSADCHGRVPVPERAVEHFVKVLLADGAGEEVDGGHIVGEEGVGLAGRLARQFGFHLHQRRDPEGDGIERAGIGLQGVGAGAGREDFVDGAARRGAVEEARPFDPVKQVVGRQTIVRHEDLVVVVLLGHVEVERLGGDHEGAFVGDLEDGVRGGGLQRVGRLGIFDDGLQGGQGVGVSDGAQDIDDREFHVVLGRAERRQQRQDDRPAEFLHRPDDERPKFLAAGILEDRQGVRHDIGAAVLEFLHGEVVGPRPVSQPQQIRLDAVRVRPFQVGPFVGERQDPPDHADQVLDVSHLDEDSISCGRRFRQREHRLGVRIGGEDALGEIGRQVEPRQLEVVDHHPPVVLEVRPGQGDG